MNHEIKLIGKQSVNKSLQDKPLSDQAEEGTFSSKESLTKDPFQKRKKSHKPQTPEQQAKREIFKKTLSWLCKTFPDCFNLSNPKPLKKRIEADIFIHLSENKIEISKRSIRNVLAFYVRQNKYHKALLENQYRFNLEGNPCEEISLADREYAKAILEMREKTKAMQHKNKNKETVSENNSGDKEQIEGKL
ncbi:MAG: ProQ/FinO family protein [Alphaproteobacteria bacterium]|nr:ProQ/FinO family protein [Alphaproteobacteria bacterium]